MYLNLLERKVINMSNNFNLMNEIMKLKEKYADLIIPLIAFKYDYPQYVKEIDKALDGVLEVKQQIEVIETDIVEKEMN